MGGAEGARRRQTACAGAEGWRCAVNVAVTRAASGTRGLDRRRAVRSVWPDTPVTSPGELWRLASQCSSVAHGERWREVAGELGSKKLN